MAGVKGRSGGPRPGSGRKAAPKTMIDPTTGSALQVAADKVAKTHDLASGTKDPAEFLEQVMGNVTVEISARMDAAKALLPYRHKKVGEAGKKEEKQAAADKASGGKFSASAPPQLHAVGWK